MFKTILAPLDGTPQAEQVIPYIRELAFKLRARIALVRVIKEETPLGRDEVADEAACLKKREAANREAESYLTGWKTKLQEQGVQIVTLVRTGPVIETIVSAATETDADLVAISSREMNIHSDKHYVSIAVSLFQRCDCPLLIHRQE